MRLSVYDYIVFFMRHVCIDLLIFEKHCGTLWHIVELFGALWHTVFLGRFGYLGYLRYLDTLDWYF